MLQSRRGFLIGAGNLLTAAFVADARSFIRRTSRPLLASPAQVTQTLHWYDCAEDGYLLTLGPWAMEPPPAPTWREFFISEGIAHQTEADAEKIWSHHLIWPEDYDKTMSERYWSDRFEMQDGPCAKAYGLLSAVDVGPRLQSARGPLLEFHEGDHHPGDNSFRVNAKNQLSLSLLQARLIDLNMPIEVVEGT
jgi:hypothetical protein